MSDKEKKQQQRKDEYRKPQTDHSQKEKPKLKPSGVLKESFSIKDTAEKE